MTKISNHSSSRTIKMLVAGDSGSGKSGALASLAAAGFNCRYVDYDNGLDIVRNVLTSSKSPYPKEALDRVEYETLIDPMKSISGRLKPVQATVWRRTLELLNGWSPKTTAEWFNKRAPNTNDTAELGHVDTWTDQDVLCIDSLTFCSIGALNHILSMNNRLGTKPYESDWGDAQQLVESLLQMLYDPSIKCNIVVNTHIMYPRAPKAGAVELDSQAQKAYPASLGKALSPRIGRYFNNVVMTKTIGAGPSAKRVISTQSSGFLELKTSAPLNVKAEYPITTGLADLFKDLRGG